VKHDRGQHQCIPIEAAEEVPLKMVAGILFWLCVNRAGMSVSTQTQVVHTLQTRVRALQALEEHTVFGWLRMAFLQLMGGCVMEDCGLLAVNLVATHVFALLPRHLTVVPA
jgi:hypothetical protein